MLCEGECPASQVTPYHSIRRDASLLLLGNAEGGVLTARGGLVLEWADVVVEGAMLARLEDGLSLDGLELGLEVFGALGVGGRV